jgi:signal transduction histidine kinase
MGPSASTLTELPALAQARRTRERRALRSLALPLLLVITIPSLTVRPRPALHGGGLAVMLGLIAVVAAFIAVVRRAPRLDAHGGGERETLALLALMGAGGVALIVAQPTGTGQLAVSLVAWIAGGRLPLRTGLALVIGVGLLATVAVGLRMAHPVENITTTGLLVALLFLMARLYRRAQADRERAEVAAAQLAAAREGELRSAALRERARIARDLHDVLAHSLSGLSLQLEGARLMAEREPVSPALRDVLARSRRLAADGVEEARRAVRALQGEAVPGLEELAVLVRDFRHDSVRVELSVEGEPRPVARDTGLALYRAAQEALTNVTRHSGADRVTLTLVYEPEWLRLVVSDNGAGREPALPALAAAGTGYGLSAMRERVALLGGTVAAGPTDDGFRIALELPA